MITGIQIGTKLIHAKAIKVELIKTLSAIGSQNFPKSETQLFFLAR